MFQFDVAFPEGNSGSGKVPSRADSDKRGIEMRNINDKIQKFFGSNDSTKTGSAVMPNDPAVLGVLKGLGVEKSVREDTSATMPGDPEVLEVLEQLQQEGKTVDMSDIRGRFDNLDLVERKPVQMPEPKPSTFDGKEVKPVEMPVPKRSTFNGKEIKPVQMPEPELGGMFGGKDVKSE